MEKQKTLSRSIIILGLFSFITSLSGESTNLALPTISHALAITNNEATWIVQIGLITTTILLVAFGHLGDILSKELIFLVGGILFTAGSLINVTVYHQVLPFFYSGVSSKQSAQP